MCVSFATLLTNNTEPITDKSLGMVWHWLARNKKCYINKIVKLLTSNVSK